MHEEILTVEQKKLLPLIREFKKNYYLVGGTAIALHLGHRHSIDFDLFTNQTINKRKIREAFSKNKIVISKVLYEDSGQVHYMVNDVKITFFYYDFDIGHDVKFNEYITIPTLLDLAAMKAFALGGRGKWKDYVDLFFILKNFFSVTEISQRAKQLFGDFFNPKLFKEQLPYFKDVSYAEPIEYLIEPASEIEIKKFLIKVATEPF
ncbi:MAG: hypothetical protein A3G23_09230 [Bacteroidetes bacterium RIFCSPLOWO2_12_FULL_37_12]|nr:MAG: hypothetical protein A3G23_09230 [Bacteroidetes bacterium RIFCSPLOWO2_12_FULL_37_12]